MSVPDFTCPSCATALTFEALFAHDLDRRAFAHLAAVSVPLGARVLAYVGLFAPPKNRMTMARKARVITELLPDLQRQAITHSGRDWEAPLAAWAIAIDAMLNQRDAGKLRLPLTGHGYLYAILQGMADKVERADESQREHNRRAASTAARASASLDIGAVLDELGPELAATQQAIASRKPVAPQPPAQPVTSPLVRQMRAALTPSPSKE